jgi:arginyl-tRNA synthetase
MVAIGYEKYGSQAEFDKDPIMHLYNIYVKVTADADVDPNVKVEARAWFKRMEDGDEDVARLARYQSDEVPGGVQAAQHPL